VSTRLGSASGDGGHPKQIPQPAFDILVRVLLRDSLHCRHEGGCRGHREAESSFQGGWCHIDKHAIGNGLCAGVTKDDLSEKALPSNA
jgi:hypothetical protein